MLYVIACLIVCLSFQMNISAYCVDELARANILTLSRDTLTVLLIVLCSFVLTLVLLVIRATVKLVVRRCSLPDQLGTQSFQRHFRRRSHRTDRRPGPAPRGVRETRPPTRVVNHYEQQYDNVRRVRGSSPPHIYEDMSEV